MIESTGQNSNVTGARAPEATAHVPNETAEPGGPQQQRPAAEAAATCLCERVGRATGLAMAKVNKAIDATGRAVTAAIDNPQQAGKDLLKAAQDNPRATLLTAGAVWIGPTVLATTAVVGGAVALGVGGARTVQHRRDGMSWGEAIAATRDDVVGIAGEAVEIKDELAERAVELKDELAERAVELKDELAERAVELKDELAERATELKDELAGRAVELTGQAAELTDQAVAEAKRAIGTVTTWWASLASKGGDKGGGENA